MRVKLTGILLVLAVLPAIQANAAIDWDINEDTIITVGEYNSVRIDYGHPSSASLVTMEGGSIQSVSTYHVSSFTLAGGTLDSHYAFDSSAFTFLNGYVRNVLSFGDAHIVIHGTDFTLGFGDIEADHGRILGTSLNGDSIFINFERNDNSRITLIPEPLTLSLLLPASILAIRSSRMASTRLHKYPKNTLTSPPGRGIL